MMTERTLTTRRPRAAVNRDENLLEVDNLSVTFARKGSRPVHAVDGVSFEVRPGQVVGIVGESGSGKSVTSLAVMGLLPSRGVTTNGQIRYRGQDLLGAGAKTLNDLRGREIAMVFQDPMSSLNPVVPVGVQVTEVLLRHSDVSRAEARTEAEELLRRCGIPAGGSRSIPTRCPGGCGSGR
jgi:peptide/nickel transport system ATP-binding protein